MKKTFFYKALLLLSILCINAHNRTSTAKAADPIKLEIRISYGTVTLKKSGDTRSGYISVCDDKSIFLESGEKKIKILHEDILTIKYRNGGNYENRQVISPIPSVLNPVDKDDIQENTVTGNRKKQKASVIEIPNYYTVTGNEEEHRDSSSNARMTFTTNEKKGRPTSDIGVSNSVKDELNNSR
jgi:hypothetical protein